MTQAELQHNYKTFCFFSPACFQVFGFLVTCVYGANTFLAIRRWRLGSGCQGATHSSEYIRARTASRGEMEARPELVWVPAAWGKVALRAATDLWSLQPRWALCLSSHLIFMGITTDEPRDFTLRLGLAKSSPKQRSWVAMKTFPFNFFLSVFKEFLVSLWKMTFNKKVSFCVFHTSGRKHLIIHPGIHQRSNVQ